MSRQLSFTYAEDGDAGQLVSTAVMMRRAIAVLAAGRWIRGDLHDAGGGSCALGAIHLGMEGYMVNVRDYRVAEAILLQTLKDMHPELTADTIPDFNDDPAVTYEDILAAFEKTAIILEERVEPTA